MGLAPEGARAGADVRVARLVADHVEPASSNAYEQVGDGRSAMALAVRWLRPKLLPEDPATTGT